ncbi:hypothetical protein A3Q56_00114 [Intoshia linei]|uniref:Uncharacterized protein n=1 Tax=Intoshia linei TaxID=1819745 RepID=A0A177BCU8_9BILA|nr:hypothetical protein A3Q56_00114 [Intoshia linei]
MYTYKLSEPIEEFHNKQVSTWKKEDCAIPFDENNIFSVAKEDQSKTYFEDIEFLNCQNHGIGSMASTTTNHPYSESMRKNIDIVKK